MPSVSLVGYTNAGKSTLFNALTRAGAYAADQLFATLDTTSVSYTHLRAHETVLDIVCRLLLVKKKTPSTSKIQYTSRQ